MYLISPRAPACAGDAEERRGSWQRLRFDRQNRRKISHDRAPCVTGVGRSINLAAGGAEINAARIERVDRHRVAQHIHVAIALRQTFRQFFPLVAAGPAAIDAQFAIGRKMFRESLLIGTT